MFKFIETFLSGITKGVVPQVYEPEVERKFKKFADDKYGNFDPHRYFVILTITGKRAQLEDLRRFVKGYDAVLDNNCESIEKEPTEFCFASILPFQEGDLTEVRWDSMAKAQIKRFGLAGNAMGVQLKEKPTELRYCFFTWQEPPKRIIETLIARYPELNIKAEWSCERLEVKGAM